MATIARNSRGMPAGVQRAYRLEMAGRTVMLLLGLLVLAGVVIFYLGVITGRALRNPNELAPSVAAQGAPPSAAPAAATPPNPAVSNALNQALTAPNPPAEGLAREGAQTAQQTDALVSRVKKELALEEVPVAAPKPAPAAQAPASVPAPSRPKAEAKVAASSTPPSHGLARAVAPPAPRKAKAPSREAESYTVQVLSTHEQRSAQELVNQLKRSGFPAYLNQFESADHKIWYRVRVGRTSLSEAHTLAEKIKKTNHLESAAVLKL